MRLNRNVLRMLVAALTVIAPGAALGQAWSRAGTPAGGAVRSLAVTPTALHVAADGGLYRSSDGGATWTPVRAGAFMSIVAAGGSRLYAGSLDGRLLQSTDDGNSWADGPAGLPRLGSIRGLALADGDLIVATNLGVYRLARDSSSFTPMSMLGLGNASVWGIAAGADDVVAATYSGPFAIADVDTAWRTPLEALGTAAFTAERFAGRLYLGTLDGIRISDDNGRSWSDSASGTGDSAIFDMQVAGRRLFAATSGGVLVTGLGGKWRDVSTGLPGTAVLALASDTTTIWAGMADGDVYRRALGTFTGIGDERSVEAASPIAIRSIFPSPASSTLTITWSSATTARVDLRLYDALGEHVATIVDRLVERGDGAVSIDVRDLPSGVYHCVMTNGSSRDESAVVIAR
jgi:hypothetical protein